MIRISNNLAKVAAAASASAALALRALMEHR